MLLFPQLGRGNKNRKNIIYDRTCVHCLDKREILDNIYIIAKQVFYFFHFEPKNVVFRSQRYKQEYAPVWGREWNLKPFVTQYLEEIKTHPFHHFDFQLFW